MGRYKDSDVLLIARRRAQEDSKHKFVYWWCPTCNMTDTTLVEYKATSRQCKCMRWMQWSYEPFKYAESSSG
ncbi:hypothetical protein LCGC14_2262210 [marine sediment metagenome]|uniref:Uncharacterized protein n=1 Tax=marine sediment metagenome TaxID=412755 RepID=A0A0F9FUF9_9ZZZZ